MAKARKNRGDAERERKRYVDLGRDGGMVHLCNEDDGAFVILEGMPHVEVPGASIPEALRALAALIEEASS